MAFTAQMIIEESGIALQDSGAARWTQPELLSYINAAVREICTKNPRASTETRVIALSAGVRQALPADALMLCRVNCNMVEDILVMGTYDRTSSIRMIQSKELLDAVLPNWMEDKGSSYSPTVSYIHYDVISPLEFYVAPGNDGTGHIEVVIGVIPAKIPVPASPLVTGSYTATIDLPDIYYSMVVDFVLYRALMKDSSLPGSKERALAHKQLFDSAIAAHAGTEYQASVSAHVANAAAQPR